MIYYTTFYYVRTMMKMMIHMNFVVITILILTVSIVATIHAEKAL
jgi:hypothetical protein